MDDTTRALVSLTVTAFVGIAILGAKWIIEDSLVEHRCFCGCLIQDHRQELKPGHKLDVITSQCMKCGACPRYREKVKPT